MRKIETLIEKEQKEKKKLRILGILLLGMMVLSTLGYAFLFNSDVTTSAPTTNSNTNFSSRVEQIGDQWGIKFGDKVLLLTSSPDNVKDISVNISYTLSDFGRKPLYIDSNNSGINTEIASTLGGYVPRVQEACFGKCEKDLPEKNCTDNIIIWRDSNDNKVFQEEGCIFIEGDIRAADAFLYRIFDIQ